MIDMWLLFSLNVLVLTMSFHTYLAYICMHTRDKSDLELENKGFSIFRRARLIMASKKDGGMSKVRNFYQLERLRQASSSSTSRSPPRTTESPRPKHATTPPAGVKPTPPLPKWRQLTPAGLKLGKRRIVIRWIRIG